MRIVFEAENSPPTLEPLWAGRMQCYQHGVECGFYHFVIFRLHKQFHTNLNNIFFDLRLPFVKPQSTKSLMITKTADAALSMF